MKFKQALSEIYFICVDFLIVYPENKTQLKAIKAVMKAVNITFEQNPEYVEQDVKESLHQAENGQLIPYTGIKRYDRAGYQSNISYLTSNI
ncbi:hypothetical protein FW774_15785 [Pedobacter sp. BS3]|uniref:DUF2683 family protein n=1 Tax=Pedobacter sp. BS3 TaxID=2567937 RepID=UPI0011EEE450|nr:DUF2683 family protein [Pedobacter sp. BS3]TZF82151.1 hypothetical protein FW774_15785 [Pedobacter sp. BS3]